MYIDAIQNPEVKGSKICHIFRWIVYKACILYRFVHVSRDTVHLKFNLLIKLVTLFLYHNINIIILLTLSL